MNREVSVCNRQRVHAVRTPLLRRIVHWLLEEYSGLNEFDLSIQLVNASVMAKLNEQFLQHQGSTDVITFDYRESGSAALHGEIVICLDDAVKQAREFRTTWPGELTRYVIHGVLHLRGYDDLNSSDRKKMKREENRLLREVGRRFKLTELAVPSRRRTIPDSIKAAARAR
ncbi:MAG: rRNA maturation RNase YbeY [Verrucomicrobia bacterium]|nr:rRNA maturation RNase YbeY [Verrucomicrobiota bacterium]